MNPYLPIRKVPLDYNGISSSAYAVQMQQEDPTAGNGWKEGMNQFRTRIMEQLGGILDVLDLLEKDVEKLKQKENTP